MSRKDRPRTDRLQTPETAREDRMMRPAEPEPPRTSPALLTVVVRRPEIPACPHCLSIRHHVVYTKPDAPGVHRMLVRQCKACTRRFRVVEQ